jgi:type IV secretion system protein VirD4
MKPFPARALLLCPFLALLTGCASDRESSGLPPDPVEWFTNNVHVSNLVALVIAAAVGGLIGALFSDKGGPARKLAVNVLKSAGLAFAGWLFLHSLTAESNFFSVAIGFGIGFFIAHKMLSVRAAREPQEAPPPKPTTFGSAEWADLKHLQENNLIGKNGFFLGLFEDGGQRLPLQYTGDRHLLTIAPTRTGKGVSAIIPNLLQYTGSAVVIDPKGENAMITADRRGKGAAGIPGLGQRVYVVDPWGVTGIKPARFNPLDWLRADDPDISENAMMLADSLVVSGDGKDPFWDQEAKALLMGVLLYVAVDEHENGQRTLGRVRDILVMDDDAFNAVLLTMAESENTIIASTAARTSSKDGRLRANVIASLQSHTHFLDSPRIRESLSASDFRFEDLKAGGMTVYLVLPADRIETFGRWLRVLIQQSITVNARNIGEQPDKPILFLLDEMAALGRLTMVAQAFGLMAGFGMQIWGIVQDLSQLERIYGAGWQTFIGNSGVLQYFGSRDQKTAEYFSKLCGMQTIEKTSLSKSISQAISSAISGNGGSSTTTHSESTSTDTTQRPLMFTDELMMMRGQKEVVLVENLNAIAGRKLPWFEDAELCKLGHNLRTAQQARTVPPTLPQSGNGTAAVDVT